MASGPSIEPHHRPPRKQLFSEQEIGEFPRLNSNDLVRLIGRGFLERTQNLTSARFAALSCFGPDLRAPSAGTISLVSVAKAATLGIVALWPYRVARPSLA
jgi:hypothetical protein